MATSAERQRRYIERLKAAAAAPSQGVSDAQIEARVRDEVAKRVEAEMQNYRKVYVQAEMILASHDGIMPRKEYRKILARLSPDACPGDDVRNAEAFKLFQKYEAVLCKPEPRPAPPGLPKTVAEMMALRRAAKAKRSAAAKRGAETRRARSGKAPRLGRH